MEGTRGGQNYLSSLGWNHVHGTEAYRVGKAAPLRGPVGCVDQGPLAKRPKGRAGSNVLMPPTFVAQWRLGFQNQPEPRAFLRNGIPDFELPGGVDLNLAEAAHVQGL